MRRREFLLKAAALVVFPACLAPLAAKASKQSKVIFRFRPVGERLLAKQVLVFPNTPSKGGKYVWEYKAPQSV